MTTERRGDRVTAALDRMHAMTLHPAEMVNALEFLAGYDPEGLSAALNAVDDQRSSCGATMPGLTPPNGCAHCGLDERDHFRRWTKAAGWHGYTEPTDAQRLERMRARRTPPAPSAATAPKRGLAATETRATPPPGVIGPANTPECLSGPRKDTP